MKRSAFYFLIVSLFAGLHAFGQSACPSVTASPNQTVCSGCATISATIQGTVSTTSYTVASIPYTPINYSSGTPVLVGIDDEWSSVIALPFCFEFYGNTFNQCVLGSNGEITFDLTQANGFNTWPISAPVPTNTVPDQDNVIMGPWHDIDPSVSGNMTWELGGTAPCRWLKVSWDQIPMFSCNNLIARHEIVLYETTNIIDIYIENKPLCSSWNGGAAIEGLQDGTMTQAIVVPGRNYPTQWTATNDAWRFTPAGAPQYTFQWLDQNNNVVGTTPTLQVCPTTTTTYTAQVVNQTCSGPITVTAQTTVTLGMTVTTASTPTSCSGNTGTATATPQGNGPFTYSWAPNGGTNANATGLAAGTYTVYVTDVNGCSGTSTVTVAGAGNLSTQATAANINCFGASTGTANVTVTGGSGPYTYSWAPSGGNAANATGLAAGTYTCYVTDASGCTASSTVVITQPTQLLLSVSSVTPTQCGQNNGAGTVAANGGTPNYTYNWSPSGGNAANATGLGVGMYTVTVTDANGCTDTVQVFVPPTNPAAASFTGIDTTGCAPLCVTFTNTSPNAATFSWNFGDGNTSTQQNPVHCFIVAGTYNVSLYITDASGCPGLTTHNAMVTVFAQPTANFSASPQPASASSPTVTFSDLSTNATTWSWSFGDPNNSTSTQQNPSFTYPGPGTYIVQLIASNGQCSDTITMNVIVEEDFTFYAPNAFSPNADGINEIFLPVGIMWEPSRFDMWIFDRWGNMIFHTSDLNKGWDGRVNGDPKIVQEDVYVWKVNVYDTHGKKHQFVGHISLIK